MILAAILTVSDSSSRGTRKDLSGPAVQQRCEELGWQVVGTAIVSDEIGQIAKCLSDWADGSLATVILTTGGTGVSLRDVTPEATRLVLERELTGVSELIRSEGRTQTPFSVLSRGLAGTRKNTLIVNLPGSPAGAVHSLKIVEKLVPHVVKLLAGETEH